MIEQFFYGIVRRSRAVVRWLERVFLLGLSDGGSVAEVESVFARRTLPASAGGHLSRPVLGCARAGGDAGFSCAVRRRSGRLSKRVKRPSGRSPPVWGG